MELDGCRRGRVFAVTTANVRSKTSKVRFKRVAAMPASDATVLRGLPVTSVDRTLIDLGDDLPAEREELAYECAFRRRLTHPRRLKQRIEEIGTRGRKGASVLRWIVDVQAAGAPTGSALEVMFLQLNRRSELPTPIRQRVLRDANGRISRVDFIYPGTIIVVEVDGRAFHLRRLKWEEDLKRRNRLTASGLRVLHVTYRRMKGDPQGVIAELAAALGVPLVVK
jgi:very-short-patch-repair endonuclease